MESEEAIVAARAAYDALPEEVKAMVSNLETLEAAEQALVLLTQPTTKLQADYSFVYIPPLEIPEGASLVTLDETQIATLAEAYENGTINSAYIGKANGAGNAVQTDSMLLCATKYGQWIAFKLRSPGTGKFDITLNLTAKQANTQKCSVYILPGDTSLEEIDSALTSPQATVSLQSVSKRELGSYSFEAGKEYVVVFKATRDKDGGTDVETTAALRLNSLSVETVVLTADLEAAQVVQAQVDAIGTVTLESEEAVTAARAAYDALTDAQKALVDTTALTAAEAKLVELKEAAEKAAADKAAADAVTAKIEAIGEVTLESEDDIKAAREAYDALTADQKALVDAAKLTAAETALEALKKPADSENPKTGDETNLVMPVVLIVVSVMGIAAGAVCRKKFTYKGKHQK